MRAYDVAMRPARIYMCECEIMAAKKRSAEGAGAIPALARAPSLSRALFNPVCLLRPVQEMRFRFIHPFRLSFNFESPSERGRLVRMCAYRDAESNAEFFFFCHGCVFFCCWRDYMAGSREVLYFGVCVLLWFLVYFGSLI